MSIEIAGVGVQYLTSIALARWMTGTAYGGFQFSYAWATTLALFCGFGLHLAAVRFVPEYEVRGERGLLRGLLRFSTATVFVMSLVAAAGLSLYAVFLAPVGATMRYLALGAWMLPAVAGANLMREFLRAFGRIVPAYWPSKVGVQVVILAVAAVAWRWGGAVTFAVVVGTVIAAHLVVMLAQGLVTRRLARGHGAAPQYAVREWSAVSLPLLLSQQSVVIINQAATILVGVFHPTVLVGYYAVAVRTGQLSKMALMAVTAVTGPRIAKLHAEGDQPQLRRLARNACLVATAASAPVTVVLLVGAGPILSLFGPEFTTAAAALRILALAQLVNASFGPSGLMLSMTGHHLVTARIYGTSAVASLALSLAIIPRWGLTGAAVAFLASVIVWNLWAFVEIRRRLGIWCSALVWRGT